MAGNANSGRKKTPIAEKKLKGTYRADRDGKQESAENTVNNAVAIPRDTAVKAPRTLSKKSAALFEQHAAALIQLGILSAVDLPELEMMYQLLDQFREVSECLKDVDIVEQTVLYQSLTHLRINLQKQFSAIAARYYISPAARTKLTLDVLDIEKKKSENENALEKILSKRKRT